MSKNEKKASCFVANIDLNLSEKLKQDLIGFGFSLSKPPYTLFSGKKKGVSVSLYQSGKLMVQGKEMQEFIEFYLEPEILKNFIFTNPEQYINKTPHIGTDEAGKGDFFGSLCVAGVYADEAGILKLLKIGIKDNKKLSDKKTIAFAKTIKQEFSHHILRIHPPKYNELYFKFRNLNTLLAWAHAAVIEQMVGKSKCSQVTIDQFASKTLISSAVEKKVQNLCLNIHPRAEEDVVVAASAILARSAFLESMERLSEEIGFELPKGASALTKEVGRKIGQKLGPEGLEKVCKKHFQTYKEVLS
ncbi:MAG: Ribonuclease HIII [Chlamydiae bacterium]|nr:Ribonuclease HIII [Chlamydiota bacterium]